jgi:hypothetical protein
MEKDFAFKFLLDALADCFGTFRVALVFYVALILFFLLSIVSATIRAWFVNVCC